MKELNINELLKIKGGSKVGEVLSAARDAINDACNWVKDH